MKKIVSGLMAAITLASSCVVAFAAFTSDLPFSKPEGPDTVLETFLIKDAIPSSKQFMQNWFASDDSALIFSNTFSEYGVLYLFVLVPDGATVTFESSVLGGVTHNSIKMNMAFSYIYFRNDDEGNFSSPVLRTVQPSASIMFDKCAGGSYLANSIPPTLTNAMRATYPGNLIIRTDMSDEPPPEPPEEGGGILDWLLNFWDTFKKFLLGLFVPEDDYFQKWFEELKVAFDKKAGGLASLFEHLNDFWKDLQTSNVSGTNLTLSTPDNLYYPGYKGVRVDMLAGIQSLLAWLRPVLGGILVVYTIMYCYNKLIAIIKGQ